MRRTAAYAWLSLCMLLAACATAPQNQEPPLVRATAVGDGNSVEVTVTGRDVALDVWSNRGIGTATVELVGGAAPAALELRLNLRALEELRIEHGKGATVISLASGPGHAISQRRIEPDGSEQAIDPSSPAWLAIRIVAAEPDPPFPLSEGHIAITLPPELIAGGARTFSFQWIDFFR
jgi:hypothetical protein